MKSVVQHPVIASPNHPERCYGRWALNPFCIRSDFCICSILKFSKSVIMIYFAALKFGCNTAHGKYGIFHSFFRSLSPKYLKLELHARFLLEDMKRNTGVWVKIHNFLHINPTSGWWCVHLENSSISFYAGGLWTPNSAHVSPVVVRWINLHGST